MPCLEPGLWFDDRYQLASPLGCGGMAEVYLAHDVVTTGAVAIKVLSAHARKSPELRRRLRYEGEVGARIIHPNLVRVLDEGTAAPDLPYLVADTLQGETLRQRLRRERSLAPPMAIEILRQAALGLEAAHGEGVVHCDVKPANLFLCGPLGGECIVKVFDFGLACPAGCPDGEGSDVAAGTLQYMAPEQVVGDPVDSRADIYGLGVVLFRALIGELPFDTAPTTGLLTHQLFSAAPPAFWLVDDLHPNLETIALTAMRKHPDNRYASMTELVADLDRVLRSEAVLGVPLAHAPDEYVPQTDSGRRVLRFLAQSTGHRVPMSAMRAHTAAPSVARGEARSAQMTA